MNSSRNCCKKNPEKMSSFRNKDFNDNNNQLTVYRNTNRSSFSSNSTADDYKYEKNHDSSAYIEEISSPAVNSANFRSSFLVYVAVFCAHMSSICMGSAFGWSGPALNDLEKNPDVSIGLIQKNATLNIDETQGNWIASSVTIGAFFGAFLCGYLMDKFGRRWAVILLGIPYGIGWVLISISWNFWSILIGRFITGIAVGITTAVVPTYIAEISTPDNRGKLGMTFNFFVVGGMFYMDLVYMFEVHWYHLSMAALVPTAIFVITMFFMPESPTWAINKIEDSTESIEVARKALKRLRTSYSDQQGELNELIQGAVRSNAAGDSGLSLSFSTLARRDVYIPMSIGAILLFFQQFCGINAVQFYLHQIFEQSASTLSPKYSALISNGLMLAATVVGSLIIEKFGRRILYMVSAVGLMASIVALGVHIMITDSNAVTNSTTAMIEVTHPMTMNFTTTSLPQASKGKSAFAPEAIDEQIWEAAAAMTTMEPKEEKGASLMPLICVSVFGIAFSLGVGPICWIIITEITPPQTIGLIVSTSSAFAWIFTFLVVRMVGPITAAIGTPATYFGFGAISIISAIFIYFIPETRGKTNEELCRVFKYDT